MEHTEDDRPDPVVIEIKGEMYRFRWPDTGEEFYATVSQSPKELSEHDDVNLELVLNESSSIQKQIALARVVFPPLHGRPISEVLQEAKQRGTIALGVFLYWDSVHLIESARKKGLEVRIYAMQ